MMSSPYAYVLALVVLLCFLAAAIAAIVLRNGNVNAVSPLITTLLGFFGPTIGILLLIIRQQHNIQATQQVQQALDGHIQQLTEKVNGAPPAPPVAPGS